MKNQCFYLNDMKRNITKINKFQGIHRNQEGENTINLIKGSINHQKRSTKNVIITIY